MTLRYTDDSDRAYGVAGMTVSMVLFDGEPYLAAVSLDNPVGDSVEFTPAFGFSGNPRLTASLAWRELKGRFELTTAMLMGNAICRAYVGQSTAMPAEMSRQLRDIVRSEGRQTCSLDDDEIDIIYNRLHRYLDRVFTHSGVSTLTRRLAQLLMERRRLSAGEVIEFLQPLNSM